MWPFPSLWDAFFPASWSLAAAKKCDPEVTLRLELGKSWCLGILPLEAGNGEGLQEIQTGSESGLAVAYVKRLGVAALIPLSWEPGKSGCQVALATGFLWGYPQDQHEKGKLDGSSRMALHRVLPRQPLIGLTPVQISLKKQISVSVLLPLRGFPKLTFWRLSWGTVFEGWWGTSLFWPNCCWGKTLLIFIWGFSHRHLATSCFPRVSAVWELKHYQRGK